MEDVIIIGAGLSGLATSFYLKQKGINAIILEARSRAGGRIHTVSAAANNTPVEMGATWFADKHTWLMRLIEKLEVPFVTQYQKGVSVYELSPSEPPHFFTMPPDEVPSYRMAGGSAEIIRRLMEETGVAVLFHVQIRRISQKKDYIEVTDAKENIYTAKRVVVTIPPYLLLQSVTFSPALPEHLIQVMQQTHTWMGDAIKFAFIYEQPFWRSNGHSGTVLSQSGIATEVYDHTNAEGSRFALKGFLAPSALALSATEREKTAVGQLSRLLGEEVRSYLLYTEKVWADDPFTHTNYGSAVFPHQNNGHPIFQQSCMNGKLYISGSETSPFFGGYMDGAVYSGLCTATNILQSMNEQH